MRPAPLQRDRQGAIAVETALVLAVLLLPLMALLTDAGRGLLLQYRVSRAMHSALVYAWGVPAAPAADILTAAQDGYGVSTPTLTATASYSNLCISPTGTRSSGSAPQSGNTCGSGQILATWVVATASTSFAPILPINWSTSAWTVSASATVRVK